MARFLFWKIIIITIPLVRSHYLEHPKQNARKYFLIKTPAESLKGLQNVYLSRPIIELLFGRSITNHDPLHKSILYFHVNRKPLLAKILFLLFFIWLIKGCGCQWFFYILPCSWVEQKWDSCTNKSLVQARIQVKITFLAIPERVWNEYIIFMHFGKISQIFERA